VKNAHLRFGNLIFTKALKKTTTRFKVPLDRFIGEPESNSHFKAHLISVIGGDTQIAALGAAIANCDSFTVEAPDHSSFHITLGVKAESYRGSLQLEGQKRAFRHLVAISEELAQVGSGKNTERTILLDDSPQFVWASLAYVHGLPGMPEWADWTMTELTRLKAVQPLIGIGCNPILVNGPKGLFMNCISRGLRDGKLSFPESNGPIGWPRVSVPELLNALAISCSINE
jgi:hypothetical protein